MKRRRLTPPTDEAASKQNGANLSSNGTARAKESVKWNEEQDYETRPRKQRLDKESTRLPIKTAEGRIQHVPAPAIARAESESSFGSLEDDGSDEEKLDAEREEAPRLSSREEMLQAKEELAKAAATLNENPEENIGALKKLAEITSSRNPTVTKLGLVTQMAVYKDIIPGYRIRPASEDELKTKLSKEVRKLRDFEQSIVGGYQKYVKELARIAALTENPSAAGQGTLSSVAISCAGNLLTSVPHFNFRSDLLQILIDKLATKRVDANFTMCREALEKLFSGDDEGNASLEAVGLLSKMIKAKRYNVDESVLNLFLHLRLLTEFFSKGSRDTIDKRDDDDALSNGKPRKEKREFWTKKQRKAVKERKAIEKEFKEADAVVGHEERDRNQAETLKLVFAVYFRILKARTPALMGPVLEGLVKYAHLINQDFFGDLLEALKELIIETEASGNPVPDGDDDPAAMAADDLTTDDVPRNVTRESLLCVITAFALLQGQDASRAAASLHLDLDFFIAHLYRTLLPAALNPSLELGAKSLHLPDPHAPAPAPAAPATKVNVSTTIVLLRSLHAVLLPATARAVPPVRVAAFTKQLATLALQVPEKSCTALLGLLAQVLRQHKRKIAALWHTEERRGDGVFDARMGRVEGSNPFAATVWEGELLRLHYAPAVREGIKVLEGAVGVEK